MMHPTIDIKTFLKPGVRAHLAGIGGVSMCPLAEVLLGMGLRVQGSDMTESDTVRQLRSQGIDVAIGHSAENLKDCDTQALFQLGRKLRHYKDFPKGANVNFYEIVGPDHVYERTYERGVEDFTYACGTGTGSVVTVLTLLGKVSGKNVRVDMTGGTLYIDVERDGNGHVTDLFLTGPTNIVCKGEITDEALTI